MLAPLATLSASDLRPGPRPPTTDERLERVLVRSAFAQNRSDRAVPRLLDDVVSLVWWGDQWVTAVIAGPDTPLAELANLRRPVPFVLFVGSPAELATVRPSSLVVSGWVRPPGCDRGPSPKALAYELFLDVYYRRNRWLKRQGREQ